MDPLYLDNQPDIVLFQILDNLSMAEIHKLIESSETLKQRILENYFGLSPNKQGELDENTVKEAIWANNKIGYEFLSRYYPLLIKNFDMQYKAKFTISLLKTQAPHIFMRRYARSCQAPRQVAIFRDEDAPYWDYKKINGEPRELLPFPPDNPEFQVISVNDDFPYPGLIKNQTDSRAQYPYLPCSFKDKAQRDLSLKRAYPGIYGQP